MKKKILILICAKGKSHEVKNKNLIKFKNQSLVEHSIIHAKKIKKILDMDTKILVSTDSKKIANIAKNLKVEVPLIRPKKLSTKTSPELDVWKHAIKFVNQKKIFNPEIVCSLPPTAPFRRTKDVINCFKKYFKKKCDIVLTVNKSKSNPYFNMLEMNKKGKFALPKTPQKKIFTRQKTPKVYAMNTTAYIAKTSFVMKCKSILDGVIDIIETKEEFSLDIDTNYDVKIMRAMQKN